MLKITLLLLFFAVKQLSAQNTERRQVVDAFADAHLHNAGAQSALFYGREQMPHPNSTSHPYLEEEKYASGRLSYNRIIYPEAMLRLDLNRDELVILSPDFRNIVLTPEKVDYVELHGKHIIYFQRNNLPGSPATGYYCLLHSGKNKVLKKQTALWMENSRSAREFHYVHSTRIFLYNDSAYHRIRNKRGVLRVLHPHKSELKQYISENRIKFRRDPEKFVTLTVKEYEKLSGQ